MQETKIYFENTMFEQIVNEAKKMNKSISEYIVEVLNNNLKKTNSQKVDFSEFAGMWKDRDISIKDLRKQAWK